MSSQDPLAELFQRRREAEAKDAGEDPIARAFGRKREEEKKGFFSSLKDAATSLLSTPVAEGMVEERAMSAQQAEIAAQQKEAFARLNEQPVFEALAAGLPLNVLGGDPRAGVAGAGVVGGALLEPLAGLTGFPTALVGYEGVNPVSDFFSRAAQGLYTREEEAAKRAGLTDEDIGAAHSMGNFAGMTLPIVASIKMASVLTGTAATMNDVLMLQKVAPELAGHPGLWSYLQRGPIFTDWVAGAIYGGVFHEGDAEARLKKMASESALWGAGRIVLNTMTQPMVAWRHRRAYELDATGKLQRYLEDAQNGLRPLIPPEDTPGMLQLMTEESFVMMSPEAQKLLSQNAGDMALFRAISDLAGAHGTGAVFRNAGHTFEEAGARLARFQQQFPHLKFTAPIRRELPTATPERAVEIYKEVNQLGTRLRKLSRKDPEKALQIEKRMNRLLDELQAGSVTYDIYFGSKGLTNKQLGQLKREGRFEGQVVQYGSDNFEYMGKRILKKDGTWTKPVEGKVFIRANKDAKPRRVPEESLTDTPFIREEITPRPEWDAAYRDFEGWHNTKGREVAAQRSSLTERQAIEAAGAGRLNIPEDGRRLASVGGAIMYPEEAGLWGEEAIQALVFKEVPQEAGAAIRPFLTRTVGEMTQVAGQRGWRLNIPDASGQIPVHMEFATLDEAVTASQGLGFEIEQVVKKYPTGGETSGLIAQTGLQHANLMEAPVTLSFDDLVDLWAKERGLPTEAVDYPAMRASFAARMRRWSWDQVPEVERKLFEKALEDQARMIDEGTLPLEVLAHEKGFHIQRLDGGQIYARHVETGLPIMFGGERVARDGLRKIVKPEISMPSILPMGSEGLRALTGGYPVQDLYHFADNIRALEFIQDLPVPRFRNLRDSLIKMQNQLGGWPIATQGFDGVIQGRERLMAVLDPEAKITQEIWSAVPKRTRRYELVDVWIEAEDAALELPEAVQLFKDRGFNAQEIGAFVKARKLWDRWFVEFSGMDPRRYRHMYYSRVRPFIEANPGVDIRVAFEHDASTTPLEMRFWAEMQRTGQLMTVEKDPELVMHKWIRAALWKREVQPAWDRLAALVGTRGPNGTKGIPPLKIADLPPAQREAIMANALPGTVAESSPVLPRPLRIMLEEFLNAIRGTPTAAEETTRAFVSNIFHRIGIKARPEVIEELIGLHMTSMYGAAMGLRASMVARNVMGQHIWNVYTRQGPKWIGPATEMSLTQQGFMEPLGEGVFHMSEAGLPYGDLLSKQYVEEGIWGTKGPVSKLAATSIRVLLATGHISRDVARKMLVPYALGEHQVRSMSYWSTKFHANEWLTKFEEGKISWDKFAEEGLPFFDNVIQKEFRQIYDNFGRERALRYIGRQGSDEANFLYIAGVQPTMLQKPFLRPFGMFGTFTLWQWELYMNRMRNGTPRQIAQFIARNMLLIAGFANMSAQTGVNMWNWVAPNSLGWFGGPDLTTLFYLQQAISAPMDQKAAAFKRFADQGMRLFYPGQAFLRDLDVATEVPETARGVFTMFAGRPIYDEHWALNNLFDPLDDPGDAAQVPSDVRQQLLVPPALLQFGGTDSSVVGERSRQSVSARIRYVPPVEFDIVDEDEP